MEISRKDGQKKPTWLEKDWKVIIGFERHVALKSIVCIYVYIYIYYVFFCQAYLSGG